MPREEEKDDVLSVKSCCLVKTSNEWLRSEMKLNEARCNTEERH